MKVSDYIADFIQKKGVNKVFVLTGGCILHCIDSISKNKNIDYIPVQNEQAGAMAADGYARVTGGLGVTMATSGPGATNLLTGVCCSFYDSIPIMVITGQVPKVQLKKESKSRQIGFQETDVVSIFKPITKYAVLIDDAKKIRYELEKAYYMAFEGRPGPVLLDICDDIQRAEIEPEKLEGFTPEIESIFKCKVKDNEVDQILASISNSKRPIFIVGAGVRHSKIVDKVEVFLNKVKIPFSCTWGAMDTINLDNDYFIGGFGVAGTRSGNFGVQNADLIIALGTRLDSHVAGSNLKNFGRGAKIIIVDIDKSELDKYQDKGLEADLLLNSNVINVIDCLLSCTINKWHDIENWLGYLKTLKNKYPICQNEYREQELLVNPYFFMEVLSDICESNTTIVTDCGSNLIWTMQAFKVKKGQRIISAFNHSPMGYSLPAVMGTFFGSNSNQNICIIGDGGMQINIQELATIHKYCINTKIFIMNNHGHGIIQGTQDNWLNSRYSASNPKDGGLPDPDFVKISEAYGIKAIDIYDQKKLHQDVSMVLDYKGPIVCVIHMKQGAQIYPKLLIGKPIEDLSPLLPRDEFRANMIIPVLNV